MKKSLVLGFIVLLLLIAVDAAMSLRTRSHVALRTGLNEHLAKPVDTARLLQKVALANHRA